MYVVWCKSRAAALAGEQREPTVFTEAFERNLEMRFAVKAFGRRALSGDIVRRTKEPYEGRLIVRMKGRTKEGVLGEGYFLEFYEETRWDRARGGFVMSSMRMRWSMPEPLGRTDMRATATRVGSDTVTVAVQGESAWVSVWNAGGAGFYRCTVTRLDPMLSPGFRPR